MSLGTSAIAAGSMIVLSRSIETCPSVSESDVADRGLGDEAEHHQHLAERRLEALLLGERDVELVLADDALGEQRLAQRDLRDRRGLDRAHVSARGRARPGGGRRRRVEARGLAAALERLAIEARGGAALPEVVEAHREVVRDVGIPRVDSMASK
jgi:hypothetical protein